MYVPPRWIRRIITIPAILLLANLVLLSSPLWLLGAAFASRFVPGKWRPLRILWFLAVYLFMDVIALFALLALWVFSGFGYSIKSDASIERHYRLFGWFLRVLVKSGERTFKLTTLESERRSPLLSNDAGFLILSRHAGPGDSFLLASALYNRLDLRPRVVLKDTLQFDPSIDILLNRIPSRFIRSRNRKAAEEIAAIGELASSLGPRDCVLIFPEGGNFTPERREKSIAYLERIERPDLAERARQMTHLIAPRPAGTRQLLQSAPGADVLIVGHAGLEEFSTLRDIWLGIPMDKNVHSRWWYTESEDIPEEADDQELWLYDRWRDIEAWLKEREELPQAAN